MSRWINHREYLDIGQAQTRNINFRAAMYFMASVSHYEVFSSLAHPIVLSSFPTCCPLSGWHFTKFLLCQWQCGDKGGASRGRYRSMKDKSLLFILMFLLNREMWLQALRSLRSSILARWPDEVHSMSHYWGRHLNTGKLIAEWRVHLIWANIHTPHAHSRQTLTHPSSGLRQLSGLGMAEEARLALV